MQRVITSVGDKYTMNIAIIGDKSRYQFLRYMLGKEAERNYRSFFTEKIETKNVYLTSNKDMIQDNVYYSKKVPLNTLILFPGEYGYEEILWNRTDRILFFDEFPYGTKDEITKLEELIIKEKLSQLEVVLFQNNRVALETDISTEEAACDEAEQRYKKRNIRVCRYMAESKPYFLLNVFSSQDLKNDRYFHPYFHEIYQDLGAFDSNYELMKDIEQIDYDVTIIDNFCKYESPWKGKNIWELFYKKAYNYFWESNSLYDEFAIERYTDGIRKVCTWDVSVDIERMKQEIRQLFAQQFTDLGVLIYDGNQENYSEFINENQRKKLLLKRKFGIFLRQN